MQAMIINKGISVKVIIKMQAMIIKYDQRVRALLDFSIYLDISNKVKFAWKIQRDIAERGHSLESIKASIDARKPDFDAYIDPQKQYADAVIEVLPTQLILNDKEGKVLRVKLITKEEVPYINPVYLFDEAPPSHASHAERSSLAHIPASVSHMVQAFILGMSSIFLQVSVLEIDGQFDRLDELIYIESHLSNISTKFYGEITQQMLKHADFPGSNNGTGLFQTIVGLKIRDLFEQTAANKKSAPFQSTNIEV
ncbi:hypothetical protein LXL04_029221 [Taraxacum kok-saghyz]